MGNDDRDAIIRKITALMAKADSTDFEAEAEALAAKAQELMTRYLVDHDELGHRDGAEVVMREVGAPGAYGAARLRLVVVIANRNGVFHHLWRNGDQQVLRLYGRRDTIEQIVALFTVLDTQLVRHLPQVGVGRRDVRSFRRAFIIGFVDSIGLRLRRKFAHLEQETPGVGLVVVQRSAEGEALWRELNPGVGLRSARSTVSNHAGRLAGRAAGGRADLGGVRFASRPALPSGPATAPGR